MGMSAERGHVPDASSTDMPADPSTGAMGHAAVLTGPSPWPRSARHHQTFAPDDVVAGRYRIVRLIAVGGSGEVYEADDLDLKQKLALKVLRPELAKDERAVEMLRREVKLARRVSHPNACRVHDVLQHVPVPDDAGAEGTSVTVLTMEFLPGRSLADTLRDAGRMPAAELDG